MRGVRGYFSRMTKITKKKSIWKRGGVTREKTNALLSDQVYEVSKEMSDCNNNTRRDAAALKEETAARPVANVEGSLALVEEAKVALEDISSPVDMTKLKVDYLEEMICSKGQIPEKGPKAVQVDQLKKLLDSDPFHLFSSHVQMKYYKN